MFLEKLYIKFKKHSHFNTKYICVFVKILCYLMRIKSINCIIELVTFFILKNEIICGGIVVVFL